MESSTAPQIVQDIVTQSQSSLSAMLETVGPAVVAIVVAGLAIWGGIALVGVIKRAFNAGKGR